MLELMKQQGRTQKQIAELVDVTEATMSRYVRGERIPSADILADIATAMRMLSHHCFVALRYRKFAIRYTDVAMIKCTRPRRI